MKRIATWLLAAIFALGSVGAAHADGIDIKVKGQWDFAFGWAINTKFTDNVNRKSRRDDDNFIARHRIRTQLNFITSEYLQGVLMFEIGNLDWGRGGSSGRSSGGALDADGVNVETKRAYLDWIIPNTEVSVRMGIQGLKLPSTPMGSPVFDADVAGVVVSSPVTDWLSVTGFWIRPFDRYANDGDSGVADGHWDDEVDVFGLLLPIKGDGWAVNPWGMYGRVGANSGIYEYMFDRAGTRGGLTSRIPSGSSNVQNESTNLWMVGTHFELTLLDPFIFNIEAIYGKLDTADLGSMYSSISNSEVGSQGWFIGATLDYKLDWGTPGIFGWWSTGDKERSDKDGKLGRLPVFGNDTGSFKPTSFGTSGKWAIDTDTVITGTGVGTWGVGIKIADVSFIEDLSHVLRVAYYQGTNDHKLVKNGGTYLLRRSDGLYLTDKDSVVEVNFDHTYQIYENLTAVVELGWLHLESDKNVWGRRHKDEGSDAWKAQMIFQYKF